MIITSDDILGKEAVDTDGEILGVVIKLHIHNKEKYIVGITIDKGFMRPDLFVGIDFIHMFGVDAVFLNTVPGQKFKGLMVLSARGEVIGHVRDVIREKARTTELIVAYRGKYLKKKQLNIPISKVKEIGESVVLKTGIKIIKEE